MTLHDCPSCQCESEPRAKGPWIPPRWKAECFDVDRGRRWRSAKWFWSRRDARAYVRCMNDPLTRVYRYRVARLSWGRAGERVRRG
jgi:hypothetical protein